MRTAGAPAGDFDARLRAFHAAVYPLLRADDRAGFIALVERFDDLFGPEALADQDEAAIGELMRRLLAEPGRYRLPPWPRSEPAPAGGAALRERRPPLQQAHPPAPVSFPSDAGGVERLDPAPPVGNPVQPPLPFVGEEGAPLRSPARRRRRTPKRPPAGEQLPLWPELD